MRDDIPSDWYKAAVAITPGFEVNGDPYRGVSGDFDGMGISCGALQWNIGSASLQPLVKTAGKAVVLQQMPTFGNAMWNACTGSVPNGLEIVRGWQKNGKLRPEPAKELADLMGSPDMRAQQDIVMGKVADAAMTSAERWLADGGKAKLDKRLFCWFFDLRTQNGGLKGITPAMVQNFISQYHADKADDTVCDFLKAVKGNSGHALDAHKNGDLWRGTDDPSKLELLCLSYLRSSLSKAEWRHVVLNRKGTIAIGKGWVNSGKKDFSALGL